MQTHNLYRRRRRRPHLCATLRRWICEYLICSFCANNNSTNSNSHTVRRVCCLLFDRSIWSKRAKLLFHEEDPESSHYAGQHGAAGRGHPVAGRLRSARIVQMAHRPRDGAGHGPAGRAAGARRRPSLHRQGQRR